jgi:hypothetical protein
MDTLETTQFAAIRQATDDKREFIDVSTIRCLQELTYQAIDSEAIDNPIWHKANPVIRVSMVKIEVLS